jgi:signal transduction histidine kinase/DNA-binding response OmpR family regulator
MEADARRNDPGPGDEPVRVLVVDDEPSVADVCREFLASEGYDLTVAPSGEEAQRVIPGLRPDIILTDINLPGLSGLEVMRFAKGLDPETCVIVVTGHASATTAIDALRQGAYDYVTKPFDLEAVLKIIKSGIAHRRLKVLNRELIEELSRKNDILRYHEQELRERVRVATSQMTSLYEAGQEVGADLELGPRLGVICAKAVEMTGGRSSIVYLRRESTEEFRAASCHGSTLLANPGQTAAFVGGEGVFGASVREQLPVRCQIEDGSGPIPVPGLEGPGARSLLAVPMVAEANVIGVLAVLGKEAGFTGDDEGFLALFAAQAAIAVRNSQLFEHTKSLDRLKSEFVAVVSHEIRTPLTSIKGAIELLTDERYFANSDQQIKLLTIAHANAERLLVLISDILDFSKLESASLPMSIERQRLEPILVQVTQDLRTLMEQRKIQLEVVLAPDLPDVLVDPNRIGQVITNLMSNAIKFSSPGGRIEVTAENWQGLVRVGVRDQGEGIAAKHLPRLFHKFSQIDSTSTRKAGGAGLGLVICKGIVEQHGGAMSVESTLGEGSTFYFTLRPVPVSADRPALVPGAHG